MAQTRKSGTGAGELQVLIGTLSYFVLDTADDTATLANVVVGGDGEQAIAAIATTNTVVIAEIVSDELMHVAVEGGATAATLQINVRALGGVFAAATVTAGSFRVA